jgi:DNA-binding NarL/FixJ family response regulator
VAGFDRNPWQLSIGISGNLRLESVAGFDRNQWQLSTGIRKTTPDRRLRERCQAVLMASRGRKRKAIAQDLGVHRTTVRLWLK